jgi:hypothetical protein
MEEPGLFETESLNFTAIVDGGSLVGEEHGRSAASTPHHRLGAFPSYLML